MENDLFDGQCKIGTLTWHEGFNDRNYNNTHGNESFL